MAQDFIIYAKVEADVSNLQKQLKNQTVKVNADTKDFDLSISVANKIMNDFIDVARSMVDEVYKLDGALTEFKKVSDLTGESLERYVDKLSEMGRITARTTSEMVEAATQFRKNSFSDEDSAKLAQIATMYQNVSDTAITAADSANFIISQMKAFGIEASNAASIIDKTNEVANNFAVGTNDISKALEVAGAGLSSYNNTFDETIALVTSGSEIMVGRSLQVARGLNTIASRIVKNKDLLKDYGIELTDANGSMRSTYDVLKDLSVAWKTMGDEERVTVGDALAGTNQYKVLAAVMTNFQTAIDAVEVSQNAAGSAARENARYMESLEAKTQAVRAAFQDLANDVVDNEIVSFVLDLSKSFLELADTGLGQYLTKVTLLTGIGWGFTSLVKASKILPAITDSFTAFKTILKGVAVTAEETTASLTLLNAALPIIGILSLIGVTGVEIYKAYQKANPTLKETTEALVSCNDQLKTNKERLEEIDELGWNDLSPEILAEKDAIVKENKELERQIELYEKRALKAAKREIRNAFIEGYQTDYLGDSENAINSFTSLEEIAGSLGLSIDELNEKITEGSIDISEYGQYAILTGKDMENFLVNRIDELSNSLEINGELTEDQIRQMSNYESTISSLTAAYKTLEENGIELTDAQQDLINSWEKYKKVNKEVRDALKQTEEVSDDNNQSQEVQLETVDELVNTYKALSSAIDDYNKYGGIQQSTIDSMNATMPNLINNLYDESGAISDIGKEALESASNVRELALALAQIGITNARVALADYAKETRGMARDATVAAKRSDLRQAVAEAEDIYNQLLNYDFSRIERDTTTTGGGGGKATDKELENLKEIVELRESELNLLQKQGASGETIRAKYRDIQDALKEQMDYLEKSGASQKDINDLAAKWYDIQEKINSTYSDDIDLLESELRLAELTEGSETQQLVILEQISAKYREQIAYLESIGASQLEINNLKIQELQIQNKMQEVIDEQVEKEKDLINARIDAIKTLASYMGDYADDKIDVLQAEIDAINEQNKELEKQITLEEKLDALAREKQRKTLVFKDGRFQYVEDVDGVSGAASDVEAFKREQEKNKQIAALEEQIKVLEGWKDSWDKVSDNYDKKVDEQLILEQLGIDLTNENLDELLQSADYWGEEIVNQLGMLNSIVSGQSGLASAGAGGGGTDYSDYFARIDELKEKYIKEGFTTAQAVTLAAEEERINRLAPWASEGYMSHAIASGEYSYGIMDTIGTAEDFPEIAKELHAWRLENEGNAQQLLEADKEAASVMMKIYDSWDDFSVMPLTTGGLRVTTAAGLGWTIDPSGKSLNTVSGSRGGTGWDEWETEVNRLAIKMAEAKGYKLGEFGDPNLLLDTLLRGTDPFSGEALWTTLAPDYQTYSQKYGSKYGTSKAEIEDWLKMYGSELPDYYQDALTKWAKDYGISYLDRRGMSGDLGEEILTADSVDDIITNAVLREIKIQSEGIDVDAEGFKSTADLLSELMERSDLQIDGLDTTSGVLYEILDELRNEFIAGQITEENFQEKIDEYSELIEEAIEEEIGYNRDVDYSALMLQAATLEEAQALAAKREAKIAGEGIDISGAGYRTTEELLAEVAANLPQHAGGTMSSAGGLSLVGEHGAELRVLNRGDGILPNDITKNLWSWGSMNPSEVFSRFTLGGFGQAMQVTISNLNVPNVTDGQSFVHYLKTNFYNDVMQFVH